MKCYTLTSLSLLLLSQVSLAFAQNFGAIGYDLDTNAYGVSWDLQTQSAADASALFECGKNGKNCQVVTRFVDQCGAYAVGPNQIWGSGYGGSRGIAENAALFYCSRQGAGCAIKVWGCDTLRNSGGSGHFDSVTQKPDLDANRRRAEESRSWGGQEQYERTCRESGGCSP